MSSHVSVITACRNSAATLLQALDSVAEQSSPADHIIIEGHSNDGSREIIDQHRARLTQVIEQPAGGIYRAINKGVEISTADIVGILHADDLFADKDVIRDVAREFRDPDVAAVYGDLEYVDREDQSRVIRRWCAGEYSPRKFLHGWMPPHPTFFVRRKCYEEYGLYRLDLGTAADYELMLRFLLVHGIRVRYIPRVMVRMRTGGASNSSLRARWRANRMDRKAWTVNGLRPYPWTLVAKPLRKAGQWWVR